MLRVAATQLLLCARPCEASVKMVDAAVSADTHSHEVYILLGLALSHPSVVSHARNFVPWLVGNVVLNEDGVLKESIGAKVCSTTHCVFLRRLLLTRA